MPKRRRSQNYTTRRNKRRKLRRSSSNKKKNVVVNLPSKRTRAKVPSGPFPAVYITKMRYVDTITMDPTSAESGGYVYHQFRANSIYDPDLTGVGHQPRGRDEMSALYLKYCVIGSKITVKFLSRDNLYGLVTAVDLTNDTQVPFIDIQDILEQQSVKTRVLGKESSMVVMRKGFSAKKFFAAASVLNEDTLTALYGSNPARVACYNIYAGTAVDGQDSGSCEAVVTIDYIVASFEPRQINGS